MRQALLSLVLFIASGTQAQFTTDHPIGSWADGIPVTDLRTFDVDTDGDQDVFVNRNAVGAPIGSLSWYQNLGNGVFAPEVVLHAGPPSYATDFDVHDVDGDGDRDIAYLITTSDVILVRLFEDGAFGAPQVWGSQATGGGYLRFIDLPSIDWYWLVVQGTNGEARPYYSTGTNFVQYPVNGNGLNLTGVTNIEAGHITGYAGDIVVQTANHLYLYIIYDSSPDNYAWFTYDIGYCDDRIQVTEVNGYFGEEITRTNNDTISYTEVYNDIDLGMVDYTYTVDFGLPVGYGTFGRIDCDGEIDIRCHWTGGDNGNEPYSYFGYNSDGFYFDPPVQSTGATLAGSLPVLVDLDGNGLNDLLEVVSDNSLHWYTNGGLAPLPVSFAPLDTLVNCPNYYYLTEGTPSGGYFTGPLVVPTFEFGEYIDKDQQPPGNYPVTYNVYDNNGCAGSATLYLTLIDSVRTIPASLSLCPSDTPFQLESEPAHAAWLSDNYVTTDGLLDISFPYQTDIVCVWTDVTGCSAYGSLPVEVRQTEYGDAHIYGWEGPDYLCTNGDPVQIYRTLATGGFELIPFDPATSGTGTFTFIGYADVNTQAGCLFDDTLFLQVFDPPVVTLDPFLDTLANTCFSGYPLAGGSPTDGYNYWDGQGTYYFESGWYFDAFGLEGNIPITYTHYDNITGCSNSATRPIVVIDSVVVVPDSIVTCPSPDPIQVLTYPNAVWGSNEVTNGIVDVSFPHQQHYLCYWTDVQGCGVYGALAVDVMYPTYGSTYIDCYCDVLCTNSGTVNIERTLADGTYDYITFDPATQGPGFYYFVGYGDTTGFTCPVNDTLFLEVQDPPVVNLDPFLDTLVNSCQTYLPLTGGTPTDGTNSWSGPGVQFFEADWYFFPSGLVGDIPVTYTHYDDATGCSNSATQYITVIDQVTTIPPSLVTCPSDVPYQLASIPANATWFDDGTTSASGLVDISQPIYTYAYAYWTDVLGCEAQGETEINVQDVSYGQAYISGWEGPDILCTNNGPVQIHVSRADGGYDLIDFDPATAGTGTYMFIGIAEDNGQYQCFADDTLNVTVLDPPFVTLAPFLDTLANSCNSGYPLVGGSPSNAYDYYEGAGVNYSGGSYVFDALGLEGNIPVTFTYYDPLTGCSNSATRPITVIDSVVVVPDSIVTCPSPDPIQVLTYPNAVWGSNEVPNGIVDVSFPHQQHYLCYWTDVVGCGVYGALAVNVLDYDYGYAYASCECTQLCSNGDPVTIYRSLPDGSEEQIAFDPQAQGAGYFYYVGYGDESGPLSCPVNDTLFLQVVDPPVVTLDPFTDTLVAGCQYPYPLTGGLPAGGYYYGDGVDDPSFYPIDQLGQVPITYQYTDGNGCTAYDTEDITVIDQITAVPDAVTTCPDTDPVQLASVPPGALWSGSSYVSPDGTLDVSTPNNEAAIGTWTDVIGCATAATVPVTVYDYTYGSVEVVGYAEPVELCLNTPPVDVLVSQADGSIATQQFDPSQGVGSYDITGFGPSAANCPVDYTLTIVVNDIPTVTLDPFTDTLVSGCSGAYVLTGGLPAGGYYDGPGVDGDFFPFAQSGQVPITYQYTDGNGCTAYDTEDITVIDQITAVPDAVTTCPDTDPVQLASVPPGALWSGSSYVSPNGTLDVSTPNNEAAVGTWTDVIGCATAVTVPVTVYDYTYGSVEVVGYAEPVELCLNTPPVDVLVSQADGSIATQQFDPSQGVGSYDITGFGPTAANCPVDYTLTIVVNDIPTVTLDPFTDALANACADGYALTGGSPAGGTFSGSGVTGDFFPQGLLGPVEITYTYTDGNGCSNYTSQPITVLGQVDATPASVTTCVDPDPLQLQSDPYGAVWSGSPNVTPNGSLDVSAPYTADIIGTWTDVIGCALQTTVPVTVNDYTYGQAYVEGIDEPVSLCMNGAAVSVVTSQSDGSLLTTSFDPQQEGVGTYSFVGYAPNSAACPVNDTLAINVYDAPAVTLAPFTDTLANSCAAAFVLTGGLPLGGDYSGSGVNGDFFAEGLLGDIAITYDYTDPNGCSSSATASITVIGSITTTPASIETCAGPDPIQLTSDMAGTVWSGSANVTPQGVVDPSSPFTADIVGTWTDAIGCELQSVVPVTVNALTNGYAYVQDMPEPVTLCQDHDPVTIVRSLAAGGEETITFDPSTQTPGSYTFTGFAMASADCPVDYILTIEVASSPAVTLALPYEDVCAGSSVPLSGGLPAGGTYVDYNGTGGILDVLDGTNAVTYEYADISGCTGSATDQITGFSVTEANGYDTATPDLCPDSDPLTFEPSPGNGTWGGVLTGPVFNPATDAGGAWSYTVTDDAGGSCGISGAIVVLPYTAATLQASLTTVCVSGAPVQVSGTNALGGTIDGPLTLEDPLDPLNPSGTFDPSVGIGDYDFSMDVLGSATSCAQTLTITISVVDAPNVTVSTFTDTLLNICSNSVYTLTQGLPAGGEWSGPGVSDNVFSPFGLSGPQTLTYTYDAGPGCQGSATGTIEVVSSVTASPYDSQTPLFACEDSQPVQLGTVPGGSVWAGAAVTPGGFVDMADPFNGILSYLFTDATGCDYGEEVQAVISPYSYGSVTIEQPGATVVCQNGDAFNIILSTASGVNDTIYFDPAIEGPGIHPFNGVAPTQIDPPGCYVDYELTVQVVDSVSLDVTDAFALYSESPFVLSGGQPAGGEYGGDAVNSSGEFMPGSAVGGWNTITYTVSSGLCPGTATDSVYVSTVGIADMAVPGTMSVWPVPARNELFISLPAGSTDVLLTLVDVDGREVARRTVSGGTTQAPLRWDIGSLANGSYALWTTGRGNLAPARVVIAH